MDASYLASVAGTVLSLAFGYLPGLKEWFDAQAPQRKAQIMGFALILVAGGAIGLACANIATAIPSAAITCDTPGVVSVVKVLIAALVANQATYLLMVRPFQPSKPVVATP